MFRKLKLFQIVATMIFVLFMGLMAVVICIAYSRVPQRTGLEMAEMQRLRAQDL